MHNAPNQIKNAGHFQYPKYKPPQHGQSLSHADWLTVPLISELASQPDPNL
jgi:hypothetical protein